MGAAEPSAAASSGGASGVLAASATGVNDEILESGVSASSAAADALSPRGQAGHRSGQSGRRLAVLRSC